MTTIARANSAGANMLKVLIAQIEQLQKPWHQMPEREQEVVIFRLREAVESSVRSLVGALAAADFPRIPAAVESVTFKDGVKAVLKLAKRQEGTHELADATGSQAIIVIASPDEFLDGIDQIRADADQAQLDLAPPPERWEQIAQALEEVQDEQPTETGDESPPVKSMGQQAQELLAKVHVYVELEVCEAWTEQECTVAAYWALEYAKDPENCRVARPHWLPMPDPQAAEGEEATEASGEDYARAADATTSESGSADAGSTDEKPIDYPPPGGDIGAIKSSEEHDDTEDETTDEGETA